MSEPQYAALMFSKFCTVSKVDVVESRILINVCSYVVLMPLLIRTHGCGPDFALNVGIPSESQAATSMAACSDSLAFRLVQVPHTLINYVSQSDGVCSRQRWGPR